LSNFIKFATMNTETIGQNAGLVWEALNVGEALGTKQIKKITKLKDKELYAALGWLAREDKVNFQETEDGKELLVSLTQDK
jgi:hypothetical protein